MKLALSKAESLQVGNISYFAVKGGGSIKIQTKVIHEDDDTNSLGIIGEIVGVSPQLGRKIREYLGVEVTLQLNSDHRSCEIFDLPF